MTNTKENPAHGWHHERGVRLELGWHLSSVSCIIPEGGRNFKGVRSCLTTFG